MSEGANLGGLQGKFHVSLLGEGGLGAWLPE